MRRFYINVLNEKYNVIIFTKLPSKCPFSLTQILNITQPAITPLFDPLTYGVADGTY